MTSIPGDADARAIAAVIAVRAVRRHRAVLASAGADMGDVAQALPARRQPAGAAVVWRDPLLAAVGRDLRRGQVSS
jgi:hypothetical protein